MIGGEIEPRVGWLAPDLEAELPGLGLLVADVTARPGRSPRELAGRLRTLSDRYTGARAIAMRQEPITQAYRSFFRQIGPDPDEQRTPPEEAVLERMRKGGFPKRGMPADALMVATVETRVATLALDADRIDGEAGLRLAGGRERLGGEGAPVLAPGQVLIADRARPLAVLFGEIAEECAVGRSTERMLLLAVRVRGVPKVVAEEALWIAAEMLTLER